MQDEMHDPRDDEPLPEQLQLAVEAMREGGPGQEALSRLRAGLGLPDPSGGGPTGQTPAGEQATGTASSTAGVSTMATPVAKALAMVGVAVTLGGLWWAADGSPAPEPPTPVPSAIASAAAPQIPDAPPIAPLLPPPTASSAPKKPPISASGASSPKTPSEVELISRAQSLVGSQPRVALNLCREHARKYPNGMLAQEREVLIVEALQRMGKQQEAREQSRSFLESHPDTALRNKVEQLTADAGP